MSEKEKRRITDPEELLQMLLRNSIQLGDQAREETMRRFEIQATLLSDISQGRARFDDQTLDMTKNLASHVLGLALTRLVDAAVLPPWSELPPLERITTMYEEHRRRSHASAAILAVPDDVPGADRVNAHLKKTAEAITKESKRGCIGCAQLLAAKRAVQKLTEEAKSSGEG